MDAMTIGVVILLLSILFFILTRAIVVWYFKIDEIVKLLKQIADKK